MVLEYQARTRGIMAVSREPIFALGCRMIGRRYRMRSLLTALRKRNVG
jgi:hypothetical protein